MDKIIPCTFNIDTACVEAKCADGKTVLFCTL